MKILLALLMLISSPALADKPIPEHLAAPTTLGDAFESGGRLWQVAVGYRAIWAAKDETASTRAGDGGVAHIGPWIILPPQSTRAATDDALTVVWDGRSQRYGLMTGEVVVFTAPGQTGPQHALPAGLGFERAFPRLGVTLYRLQGGDVGAVRRLAAMPGILGAEVVVKTKWAIAH